MATLEDAFNLGYDVSEFMRVGDPPKFGKPDARVVIWLVEGYGTYTQVAEDNQEAIDGLADPQPPQKWLVATEQPAVQNLIGDLTMRGFFIVVNIPGFPESPDTASATFDVTDPEGHEDLGVSGSDLQQILDDHIAAAEASAAEASAAPETGP